jgi:hypothetical protein
MEVSIRASSLAELFDCPARFKAKNIDGMRSPTSGAAHLGTSLHASTGAFDQAVIEGSPISIEDACDKLVDTIKNPSEAVAWADVTRGEAIDRGVLLTTAYCRDIAPNKTYEAVELQCAPLVIAMNNGVRLTLTGTTDRIRVRDEKRGISDMKSGARIIKDGAVDVDKHAVQLGTYELIEVLTKNTTGKDMTLDAEVVALPTKGAAVPQVATITRPSRLLFGDAEHVGLLDAAAAIIKSGSFYGNTKSTLCSERYCPAFKKCWWRANPS